MHSDGNRQKADGTDRYTAATQAQRDEHPVITDGGRRLQEDKYYILDERRTAVVGGPFDDEAPAREAAADHDSSHIIILGSSLRVIQSSGMGIRWELGDGPDLITDGGIIPDEVDVMPYCGDCSSPLSWDEEDGSLCAACADDGGEADA